MTPNVKAQRRLRRQAGCGSRRSDGSSVRCSDELGINSPLTELKDEALTYANLIQIVEMAASACSLTHRNFGV